jgi:hypothetical protein
MEKLVGSVLKSQNLCAAAGMMCIPVVVLGN